MAKRPASLRTSETRRTVADATGRTRDGSPGAGPRVTTLQWLLMVLIGLLVVAMIWMNWSAQRSAVPMPAAPFRTDSQGGLEVPEPWHYDAERNRHWHPAHGHWHDGPPPPPQAR